MTRRRPRLTEEEQRLGRLLAPDTAASTVEALVYQLRRGGTGLSDPKARQRLSELSEQQLHEVSARLQEFMAHIARAWSPSEVELLVQLWSDLHG
jgi:transposase